MTKRPAVVAFDIIETVFALEPLRSRFVEIGLPGEALELWFAQTLRDAFALGATGAYRPFREIAAGPLVGLLAARGLPGDAEQVGYVLDGFTELGAHPDSSAAMRELKQASFRMIALTNGNAKTTEHLLARAELAQWIERVVSVDEIRCWKPRAEIYRHAAAQSGVEPQQLGLVAAHAWDVHGAQRAGLIGAYVSRGMPFPPSMGRPDIAGETLVEVAAKLIALT